MSARIDRPAQAVWDRRADPECTDLESTPRSAVRPISCQSHGQPVGDLADWLAALRATVSVVPTQGAGVK